MGEEPRAGGHGDLERGPRSTAGRSGLPRTGAGGWSRRRAVVTRKARRVAHPRSPGRADVGDRSGHAGLHIGQPGSTARHGPPHFGRANCDSCGLSASSGSADDADASAGGCLPRSGRNPGPPSTPPRQARSHAATRCPKESQHRYHLPGLTAWQASTAGPGSKWWPTATGSSPSRPAKVVRSRRAKLMSGVSRSCLRAA